MSSRRQFLSRAIVASLPPVALPFWSTQAIANATTISRSARIVVGFTPGGSADLVGRALAAQMISYAPSVIVENRPGAGGRIALDTLKAADPDGSTICVSPSSMITVYPHIYRKLGYDPLKDLTTVAVVATFPFVVVVGPMVPQSVRSIADFLAWCRSNPAQAAYASPGNGSTPHFLGAGLARAGRVEMTHVAYKGGAPAMNDVLGGQIASNMAVISNALPLLKTGKLRALAVTGTTRSPALPDVPTLIESGFPELGFTEWFGVYLPANTPDAIKTRLNAMVTEAVKSRAMQDVLSAAAFEASPAAGVAESDKFMRADFARWGALVKASGFTPED